VRDEVTGIVISIGATSDKISLWMRHGNNPETVRSIKKDMLRVMELPDDTRMEFSLFFKNNASHHSRKEAAPSQQAADKSNDRKDESGKETSGKYQDRERELKPYRAVAAKAAPKKDS